MAEPLELEYTRTRITLRLVIHHVNGAAIAHGVAAIGGSMHCWQKLTKNQARACSASLDVRLACALRVSIALHILRHSHCTAGAGGWRSTTTRPSGDSVHCPRTRFGVWRGVCGCYIPAVLLLTSQNMICSAVVPHARTICQR